LPEQASTTAADYISLALEAFDEPPTDLSTRLLPDTEMGRLASTYLLVLLEGDRRRACRLILDALGGGRDVHELYLGVLLPAQEELGRMWLANEINVAEEHFASQTTKMVLSQLLPRATLRPSNGKAMLAASVAGNQHDIGLQAVADFFEMDGWRTILLGANVPARDLVQAIDCFEVDLLGISVSQTTQLDALKATIQALRNGSRGNELKILLGGRALIDPDNLPKELGADGYAANPAEAVTLGRKLVGLK
jgi:methanogenic corrinoid protein MtbC1